MDWQEIKAALCASRDFKQVPDGYSVIADTMMPSGLIIRVHLQLRNGRLFMHDNGAAFDELACTGAECRSASAVRNMLSETKFGLSNDGKVFRDDIDPVNVGTGVAMVADASFRAAAFMLAHAKVKVGQPLDVRVRNALRQRYPQGTPKYRFDGEARQQTFDFGFEYDGRTVLVDAVTPDLTSVNAAIVKSLDAMHAPQSNARPILIYDESDHWTSDHLNLLKLGGERVSFKRVAEGRLLDA